MKYDLSLPIDQSRARVKIESLIQKGAKVELKKFQPVRSMPAHKYAHVCIEMFGRDLGYTIDEAKQVFKKLFASEREWATYTVNGETFLKSFEMKEGEKYFNSEETAIFIDWLRNLANEHGCFIPSSDEYLIHQWEIEKNAN